MAVTWQDTAVGTGWVNLEGLCGAGAYWTRKGSCMGVRGVCKVEGIVWGQRDDKSFDRTGSREEISLAVAECLHWELAGNEIQYQRPWVDALRLFPKGRKKPLKFYQGLSK